MRDCKQFVWHRYPDILNGFWLCKKWRNVKKYNTHVRYGRSPGRSREFRTRTFFGYSRKKNRCKEFRSRTFTLHSLGNYLSHYNNSAVCLLKRIIRACVRLLTRVSNVNRVRRNNFHFCSICFTTTNIGRVIWILVLLVRLNRDRPVVWMYNVYVHWRKRETEAKTNDYYNK